MNQILLKIQKVIEDNRALYLPHVKNCDLEKDGAIFYMNGNNGTEFDWYVNDKLPAFMVFYNDEDNLGAVKLSLCKDGGAEVYLYDEKGKKFIQEIHQELHINEEDLVRLAATLKNEADDKSIWNADIEKINTDLEIDDHKLDEFKGCQENYTAMKNRRNILNQSAYVSKKIITDGWKVGYMERMEPYNEQDSGWFFASGTEEEDYLSDCNHVELVCVGNVWQQFDQDIFRYIDMPIGTKMIRISQQDFEVDKNDKGIFTVKR